MIRVLIADDEETIREGIRHQLVESGLNLEIAGLAENGEMALEMVEQYHPEIILLDINMPKKSGLEILEEIIRLDPLAKILIISGYDEFEYARKALSLGVFDYLLKPVNIATLKTTVARAIEQYEQRLWEVNQLSRTQKKAPVDSLDQIIPYIQTHFIDPDLNLKALAEHFHTSDSYLSRMIRKQCGVGFSELLLQLRMEQAKKLLRQGNHMIYEVATLVGYSSQHYFCRTFKEYTGFSPSDYRAKENQDGEKDNL